MLKAKFGQERLLEQSWFIAFLFALAFFLVRVFLRAAVLELDEAEQVVLAQQLNAGYPDQPPLYSWLQFVLFGLFGRHLAVVALLKSLLLFGCLFTFHQICRLHCFSPRMAWCATAAWALLPPISFDLIKDNTHSVFVLFSACLTWYWFVAPRRLNHLKGYLIFGVILGVGLLSKFNYLLFLTIMLLSALSLKEYRNKLLQPLILLSLGVGLLIASPYLLWLLQHASVGLHSSYKFMTTEQQQGHGILKLFSAALYFTTPCLLMCLIFFPYRHRIQTSSLSYQLLFRFHLLCPPILFLVVFLGGISHIEARWLIPILFLFPLLYLGQQPDMANNKGILFIRLCLLLECLLFAALVYRSHFGNLRHRFPLQQVEQQLRQEQLEITHIVSDSLWILGNLMVDLSIHHGWLVHPAALPKVPAQKVLFLWQTPQPPDWTHYFVTEQIFQTETHTLKAGGGYLYYAGH